MKFLLDILTIWTPLAIGVLMLLAGLAMPNAGLIISGVLCVGVTFLLRVFLRNIERSRTGLKR